MPRTGVTWGCRTIDTLYLVAVALISLVYIFSAYTPTGVNAQSKFIKGSVIKKKQDSIFSVFVFMRVIMLHALINR